MKKTILIGLIFSTLIYGKYITVCNPPDGCETIFIYGDDKK